MAGQGMKLVNGGVQTSRLVCSSKRIWNGILGMQMRRAYTTLTNLNRQMEMVTYNRMEMNMFITTQQ
ncbi:hypothetical protein FRX31_030688 [Thalictrum thalictroides]|uniref:Uncharacterized protein n=1 Tax=Thalictrum thalictroides TaxID=46969 RepID=A0A7J6V3T4_THATH|nr:hypothetical protein FRX31_030688 [Thalictrum thalictroides]